MQTDDEDTMSGDEAEISQRSTWKLHSGPATCIDSHDDRNEIVTGGEDGTVNLFFY